MEFPLKLANEIVNILHAVTLNNVNFMGEGGIIQASIQKERIGTIHEGAKMIMSGKMDELAITFEDAENFAGVKPGYNGVIIYQNKRLGCIGLSGDPEKMKPLQQLASIVVKEEYEKYLFIQKREQVIENIIHEIDEASIAIQQISVCSLESLNYIKNVEETANDVEKNLIQIDDILKILNNIIRMIELLGFNAIIEASRAGELGAGFNVVAKEIRNLSSNSKKSVADISQFLLKIQANILDIVKGVHYSSKISQDQSLSLQSINEYTRRIESLTEKLNEKEKNT